MPRRLVVCFRGPTPGGPVEAERYLAQVLAVKRRAEAHGATLCAWSALTFSFCFEPDELEEAVRLAELCFTDAGAGLRAGLAEGELMSVGERGSLAGLGWGMALLRASQLSRAARPGELLTDEDLYGRRGEELAALGVRGDGDPTKRLLPVSQGEPSSAPLIAIPMEPEPPPSTRFDPTVESAKRALLQGDVGSLEGLIAELRRSGEHADLVERMSGFAALRRGATADALRRLRSAAETAKEPGQRARARLAYAVALAGAGRAESALLEALEALARAREAHDPHGEHACALFLARISAAAGQLDAASTWAIVATKAEAAYPSP